MSTENRTSRAMAALIVLCSIGIILNLLKLIDIFIPIFSSLQENFFGLIAGVFSIFGIITVYACWDNPRPKGAVISIVAAETLRRLAYYALVVVMYFAYDYFYANMSLMSGAYNYLRAGCLIISLVLTAILLKKSGKQGRLVFIAYLI